MTTAALEALTAAALPRTRPLYHDGMHVCARCGVPLVNVSPRRLYCDACRREVTAERMRRRYDSGPPNTRAALGRSERPRTLRRGLSPAERRASLVLVHPEDLERPRTRGECIDGPRPCPWVSCRYHLYVDAQPSGTLKLNFPGVSPDALDRLHDSCALDVADRGHSTLEVVAVALNLTRERVRQVEVSALRKLRRSDPFDALEAR